MLHIIKIEECFLLPRNLVVSAIGRCSAGYISLLVDDDHADGIVVIFIIVAQSILYFSRFLQHKLQCIR